MDAIASRVSEEAFARSVIGEVLSDNAQTLEDLLLDATETSINCLGDCGETPAHIAIYKNHGELLLHLLQAGADPMRWNEKGDSLIHTAVLLGHCDLLFMLYDTGKCNLEMPSKLGRTPLDIAAAPFEEQDLVAAALFKNWSRAEGEEDVQKAITAGRRRCFTFLEEKIALDRRHKIEREIAETSQHMMRRDLQRRWTSDSSGIVQISYSAGLDYPTGEGRNLINAHEQTYFKQFKDALNTTTTRVFAHEVVLNSIFMNR